MKTILVVDNAYPTLLIGRHGCAYYQWWINNNPGAESDAARTRQNRD